MGLAVECTNAQRLRNGTPRKVCLALRHKERDVLASPAPPAGQSNVPESLPVAWRALALAWW